MYCLSGRGIFRNSALKGLSDKVETLGVGVVTAMY